MRPWWAGRGGGLVLKKFRGPALAAIAYYLGAEAAFLIGTLSDRIFAPFWPPNIILFSALMLVPYRQWPLYLAAALPAHLAAELRIGMNGPQLWIAFATNCAVATINAFGMRYLVGQPPWLDTVHKALVYVLVTAVIGPAFAALGGALVRIAGGGKFEDYWLFWEQWYAANALASITLGVVLLAWMGKRSDWVEFSSHPRRTEALSLTLGVGLACLFAVSADALTMPAYVPAFLYLPLPLILWAAVRFRTVGASATILIVTIVSISVTLNGPTVFSGSDVEANVLALQLFLVAISVPTLFLGACIDGLRQAEATVARLAQFALSAQDDERRRVANGLHEGVAQNLVAALWLAGRLDGKLPRAESVHAERLEHILRTSIAEIRALSHLLHPPLLDEAGLECALQSHMKGYSKSSGMTVDLEFVGTLGRLPPDVELTIFRLIEEALSNVNQHAGGPTARIRIEREQRTAAASVRVTIENEGKDIGAIGRALGTLRRVLVPERTELSFARMRERLRHVGGRLAVQSTAGKIVLLATIPLANGALTHP